MDSKLGRAISGAAVGVAALALAGGAARAATVTVATSGGFSAAYKTLTPQFECESGDTLATLYGPSMGTTGNTVPARLGRGESIDVVILVGYALDDLIKKGLVLKDSKVDLAQVGIGAAVKAGAPHPDISTVAALKKTLLASKSVAYSDSASGVYIKTEMFPKMGIAEQMAKTGHMIPADPVGGVVAKGEADIGFQAYSELKPIPGIELIGQLPAGVQHETIFSAGVVSTSKNPAEARKLVAFLASPAAKGAVVEAGMEPLGKPGQKALSPKCAAAAH